MTFPRTAAQTKMPAHVDPKATHPRYDQMVPNGRSIPIGALRMSGASPRQNFMRSPSMTLEGAGRLGDPLRTEDVGDWTSGQSACS